MASRSTVAPDAPRSARKNSAWTRARAGCTAWTSFRDQCREPAARVVADVAPASQTARRENRRRAEGEVREQLREIRRAPAERLQIAGEQIVDVRTKEVRIRLRERLVVRPRAKLTGSPRPQEGRQFRIQQERRGPFPPIVDASFLRVRQPRVRKQIVNLSAHPRPAVLPGRRVERMRPIRPRQARQQQQEQSMTGSNARRRLRQPQQRPLLRVGIVAGVEPASDPGRGRRETAHRRPGTAAHRSG